MGIFSWRKKDASGGETIIDIVAPKHEHTWKDMPWYMEIEYDGGAKRASYQIIEPYLCITCGERKNKILETESWEHIDSDTREQYYKEIRKRYKDYLKPRAVVEDMIANIQMVKDPNHLAMMEKLKGIPHSGCGTSSKMDWSENKDYKINIGDKT